MVSQLTGMDVTNASMYDGATAVTEAVLLAQRARSNTAKVIVAGSLHPFYRQVMRTYVANFNLAVEEVPWDPTGRVDLTALAAAVDDATAAVVVQSPNFFGAVEDVAECARIAHARKALLVMAVTEAASLAAFKAPGELGADVVAGEGQSFGIPVSFGGPYLGIFSTRSEHLRRMPGRVVGMTEDTRGRRGFVLTLSTASSTSGARRPPQHLHEPGPLCADGVRVPGLHRQERPPRVVPAEPGQGALRPRAALRRAGSRAAFQRAVLQRVCAHPAGRPGTPSPGSARSAGSYRASP